MKEFIINKEQGDLVLAALMEMPAKISFNAITVLHHLPERIDNTAAEADASAVPTS